MRVQVFENLTEHGYGRGYEQGDLLRLSWEGYISPDDGDTSGLLDEIFVHFNRDDRPNSRIRTALSTGDVVTLEGGPRRLCESYGVTGEGFKKLRLPHTATGLEKLSLVQEMREHGLRAIPRLPRLKERI